MSCVLNDALDTTGAAAAAADSECDSRIGSAAAESINSVDIPTVTCVPCGVRFPGMRYFLQQHVAHHRPEEEEVFSCHSCASTLAGVDQVTAHCRTHETTVHRILQLLEQSAFECGACGEGLELDVSGMRRHLAEHMRGAGGGGGGCGSPKVRCIKCRTFIAREDVRSHVRLHLMVFHFANANPAARSIECGVCGVQKTFRALPTHLKSSMHMNKCIGHCNMLCMHCGLLFMKVEDIELHFAIDPLRRKMPAVIHQLRLMPPRQALKAAGLHVKVAQARGDITVTPRKPRRRRRRNESVPVHLEPSLTSEMMARVGSVKCAKCKVRFTDLESFAHHFSGDHYRPEDLAFPDEAVFLEGEACRPDHLAAPFIKFWCKCGKKCKGVDALRSHAAICDDPGDVPGNTGAPGTSAQARDDSCTELESSCELDVNAEDCHATLLEQSKINAKRPRKNSRNTPRNSESQASGCESHLGQGPEEVASGSQSDEITPIVISSSDESDQPRTTETDNPRSDQEHSDNSTKQPVPTERPPRESSSNQRGAGEEVDQSLVSILHVDPPPTAPGGSCRAGYDSRESQEHDEHSHGSNKKRKIRPNSHVKDTEEPAWQELDSRTKSSREHGRHSFASGVYPARRGASFAAGAATSTPTRHPTSASAPSHSAAVMQHFMSFQEHKNRRRRSSRRPIYFV